MKSIKNHIVEYGYLGLFVMPAFFVASYLFNITYFYCFDVKISKIPLAVSDYILSINILGIVLLSGIFYQILGMVAGHFFGKKISKKNLQEPENFDETAKKSYNTLCVIKVICLVLSVVLLSAFAIIVYRQGMIAASFIYLSAPILLIYINFFVDYDKPSFLVLLIFPMCLITVLDSAVKNAKDDYKNNSVEITTGGSRYFIMRNFENGYWVKSSDTGEVLFITKTADILNFHIPKQITEYLKK